MSPFAVFLPHFLCGLGALVLAAILMTLWTIPVAIGAMLLFDGCTRGRQMRQRKVAGLTRGQWEHLLYRSSVLLISIGYVVLFLRLSVFWIRATPTPGWQQQTAKVDTVLVFGFGIESDAQERIQPGAANRALLDWALDRRHGGTMLVQEGVLAAANEEPRGGRLATWDVRRMHRHLPGVYVDTLHAAYCAVEQMERLGRRRALVVTHDLQLARAAADLRRVAAAVVIGIAGLGTQAHAESVLVDIDFEFLAGNKVMPPGSYEFQVTCEAAERVTVRSRKGGADAALLLVVTRLGRHDADPELVFDKVDGKLCLAERWIPNSDGYLLITTAGPHEHRVVGGSKPRRKWSMPKGSI